MSTVSHDFVSVDMRGMKAALVAHARARRLGVSMIVRSAVARELQLVGPAESFEATGAPIAEESIKVSIRHSSADAARLAAGAREAGLSRGAYVAALVSSVAVLSRRTNHVAALTASCGELALLSRNIHHLTSLLRQGSVRAAQEYRGDARLAEGGGAAPSQGGGGCLGRLATETFRPSRNKVGPRSGE